MLIEWKQTQKAISYIVLFLVVSFVIAVLAPVYASAHVAANRVRVEHLLKADMAIIELYVADNTDHFPPDMSSGKAILPFISKYTVNGDDGSPQHFEAIGGDGEVVLGNPRLSGHRSSDLVDPGRTIALYATLNGKPVGAWVYCDGHAWFGGPGMVDQGLSKDPYDLSSGSRSRYSPPHK